MVQFRLIKMVYHETSSSKRKSTVWGVEEEVRTSFRFPKRKRSVREEVYRTMNGCLLPKDTPDWLIAEMRNMRGYEPHKIAEKTLTKSDVKKGEGRLLIPFSILIEPDFLNSRELKIMEEDGRESEKINGVGTLIIDRRSVKWGVNLRRWDMKKQGLGKVTMNYVLVSGWNQLVEANGLEENDSISIWSFRSRGVLCLAIAP